MSKFDKVCCNCKYCEDHGNHCVCKEYSAHGIVHPYGTACRTFAWKHPENNPYKENDYALA